MRKPLLAVAVFAMGLLFLVYGAFNVQQGLSQWVPVGAPGADWHVERKTDFTIHKPGDFGAGLVQLLAGGICVVVGSRRQAKHAAPLGQGGAGA